MKISIFIILFTVIINYYSANNINNVGSDNIPLQNKQTYTLNVWLNASYYKPDQTVQIFAEFLDDLNQPVENALCSFQINDPSNVTKFFDTSYTNSSGIANTTYHLLSTSAEGRWYVYVSADDGEHQAYANDSFYVDASPPAEGTITSPVNGSAVSGTSVTLTAKASDTISGVAYVEYYIDGTTPSDFIGSSSTAPYTFSWDCTGETEGSHQLFIRVYDNVGNSFTNTTPVYVTVDNTEPYLAQITSPTGGEWVSGNLLIQAAAADTGTGVQRVEFWNTTTLLGIDYTSPYEFTWDTTLTADGTQTLHVEVYDEIGNVNNSGPTVQINIDNTNATSSIYDPSPNEYLRGVVTIFVSSTDPGGAAASGVAYVEVWNSTHFIGNTTNQGGGIYTYSWDTTTTTQGAQTLYSRVRDNAGNLFINDTGVPVVVDNIPPSQAQITSPSDGDNITSPYTIVALASDATSGVDHVNFFYGPVGAGTLIGTNSSGVGNQYSISWTPPSDAPYTLYVMVVDRSGNHLNSTGISVTVDNTVPNQADITAPSSGAYVRGTLVIQAAAADAGTGVQRVEFWNASTLLGTDYVAPYQYSWDTTLAADGSQTLTVRVYDYVGLSNTSAGVTITVDNTNPSQATITDPTDGANITSPYTIVALASDATSGVDHVNFFYGPVGAGTLIGTDTTGVGNQYSISWT
ncbi:MAG: Ig-like domain-containing protein, partial [Candidatus Helarchaeota archaeon]